MEDWLERVWLVLLLAAFAAATACLVALTVMIIAVTMAHATELHFQQPDGEAPIVRWHVTRFGSPTPVETIDAASIAPGVLVTPGPWFPTPGPGTPTPIVRDYLTQITQPGGSLITLSAEDSRGLRSLESNLKQLPSETPTPLPTRTPTQTRTQSATRTATNARPAAPQVL